MPDEPSDANIAAATQVILDLYEGFPFGLVTDTEEMQEASRANAIGLLITVMIKKMYPDMLVPIHIAEAGQQSSGKSLVAMELPGLLAGGHSTVTFTPDDAEMRKRFTTELANGSAAVLCFDNVNPKDTFESAVVAAITTSLQWDDRLLGSNTKISRPMDRILTCTGNNLRVGPDLRARSVPIILDPHENRPAARVFDVNLDDAIVRTKMRPKIMSAVLTVVRGWALRGCLEVGTVPMRQFTPGLAASVAYSS